MHIKTALSATLALLLTGSLLTAQTEVKKPDHPQNAAASKIEPAVALQFSVSGLTKDNLDTVKQSLSSMEAQTFACDGCKHEQAMAGRCSTCDVDLKGAKKALLGEVVLSLESQTIHVTPVPARTLHYSDLEGALKKNSVQIDSAKFPIAGQPRLILLGGTLENAKAIEKGLLDAKLFDTAKADFDVGSGQIRIWVRAGATVPMRAKVVSTIDGLGTKAKLSDVAWGPPMASTKA